MLSFISVFISLDWDNKNIAASITIPTAIKNVASNRTTYDKFWLYINNMKTLYMSASIVLLMIRHKDTN